MEPALQSVADFVTYHYDSFGNAVPASPEAIAAGIYPPPLPPGVHAPGSGNTTSGETPDASRDTLPKGTFKTPGYVSPNILVVMVDQLRAPRWLPATGGQSAVDAVTPNIAMLRNHSTILPNYYTAATNCTPARASLLTGLYSQQTCMFKTQASTFIPSLQPYAPATSTAPMQGFPTFATVLSQAPANYQCYWMGKWHLSAIVAKNSPQSPVSDPGGPASYGFNSSAVLPANPAEASPNGECNEGTDGLFPADPPNPPPNPFPARQPSVNLTQYNDAYIANYFLTAWLATNPVGPWCTTVSFINPHDMSVFPWSYGLCGSGSFGFPLFPANSGYLPPSTAGVNSTDPNLFTPPLPSVYSDANPPVGPGSAPWNVFDTPTPYLNGVGKPDLQSSFLNGLNNSAGSITGDGWDTFLNYYLWMQSCVDYQVGRVINALYDNGAGPYWANTVIILLSDHGDYGGSHGLHAKGGALYDEVINVPLYISFPSMRKKYFVPGDNTSIVRSYVCSSVDILPLLYEIALGNGSWRTDPANIVNYLSGRESIFDAVHLNNPSQRRLSSLPNSNQVGFQPYILHTTDDVLNSNVTPTHAIAFRTADVTTNPYPQTFGGAKLGMYSFWQTGPGSQPTMPVAGEAPQYEFYDFTGGNYGEVGNEAFSGGVLTPEANSYVAAYNAIANSELYIQYPQIAAGYAAALAAFRAYLH